MLCKKCKTQVIIMKVRQYNFYICSCNYIIYNPYKKTIVRNVNFNSFISELRLLVLNHMNKFDEDLFNDKSEVIKGDEIK